MAGENMDYLIGLLGGVGFFVVYELGKRQGKPKQEKETPQPTEEELHQAQKIRNDFQKLMNYDVEKAIERKQEV